RSDDLGDTKFETLHAPATGNHVHTVMRLELECLRVTRVHFKPCVRRHALEDWNFPGLRARVPMFDGSSGVQHKRELAVGLFREGLPFNAEQLCLAVFGLEFTVRVKARDPGL